MGYRDLTNYPELYEAMRSEANPAPTGSSGGQMTTYDWLDQIAHTLAGAGLMRGGFGSPVPGSRTVGALDAMMARRREIPQPGSAMAPQGVPVSRVSPVGLPENLIPIGPAENPMTGIAPAAKPQPTLDLAQRAREVAPLSEKPAKATKFTPASLAAVVQRVRAGDEGAKAELSTMLEGVIGKVARRFAPQAKTGSVGVEDLMQEGQEVAMRAAKSRTYRPDSPFLTYLNRALRSRLQAVIDETGNLTASRLDMQLVRKLDQANQTFYKMRGRLMTANELQEATGIPAPTIRKLYMGQEAEGSLAFPRPPEE